MIRTILILFFILITGCGVKRPPKPAYDTALPFEETAAPAHAVPSASPTVSPSPGKGR